MQNTFYKVIEELLTNEGGYVEHPKDPGGATNLGITLGTAVANKLDLDKDGDVDKADVRLITMDVATAVYKKQYWDKVSGDELPAGLDYAVLDFGVHSGPKRAIMSLQRLVNVADDGIIGTLTLKAIRDYGDLKTLINRYQDDRLRFMQSLSTFPTFGRGWTNRITKVRNTALALSANAKIDEPVKKTDNPWAALVPILITLLTALFGWLQSRK